MGLRLLADSGFRMFSDGYHLLWEVGRDPRMWRSEQFQDGPEVPLDQEHRMAEASPTGLWLTSSAGGPFLVGRPGHRLSVEELILGIQTFLTAERRGARYFSRHSHLGDTAIAYAGLYPARSAYTEACHFLRLKCY